MKWFTNLLLVAGVVAVARAHPGALQGLYELENLPTNPGVDTKIIVNTYFDNIIALMKDYIINNDLQVMHIPDALMGFCVRYLFVDWHGELELTQGTLTDLSTISREGDAELTYGVISNKMNVKAVIGFRLIDFYYDYLAKIMNIGPDGGIEAKVTRLTFAVDIEYNTKTGEAHVNDISVLHTGWLDVHLTGTVILDEIVNAIADVITILYEGTIMNLIASTIENILNNILSTAPPPTTESIPISYDDIPAKIHF